jgi:hypothetical protein
MTSELEKIEDRTRTLNPEERAKLAEIESAWADQIDRCVDAFDRGELTTYPAVAVFVDANYSILKGDLLNTSSGPTTGHRP